VLHYAVRKREDAAFKDELRAWSSRVRTHISSEAGGRLRMAELVRNEASEAHFYCCGPESMLASFSEATAMLPPERVHLERFTAAKPAKKAQEFLVDLRRSARTIAVAADQSIVDALLHAGIDVPYSCQQGICGSCEVKVLEGIPDHRDDVLTQAEKDGNATMMICCSRAKTETLVLDL
jgi:vanillate O-demethylase ferredoxin subunit